jgi:hypothetical protein
MFFVAFIVKVALLAELVIDCDAGAASVYATRVASS